MRKVAKKVCKLSLFSQLSAPMKSGVSGILLFIIHYDNRGQVTKWACSSKSLECTYEEGVPFYFKEIHHRGCIARMEQSAHEDVFCNVLTRHVF